MPYRKKASYLLKPLVSNCLSTTFQFGLILNALFFLFYGFQSLNSQMMIDEFKRFGMSDPQRKVTGILQIMGSAGLLIGLIFPEIGLLAAAGFTAMMFMAFIVRIKIKDSILQSLPSIIFMLINGWLAVRFYNLW